jgi:threonine dehydratase
MSVSLQDVLDARERVAGLVRTTPLLPDERLSEHVGARVVLKAENTQRSGSFKARGAFNRMLQLTDEERRRGVIAQSAGNHAQGVAMAAQHLGIPAVIVMPERAPLTKVMATRRLGAEVILFGESFDACSAKAAEVQAERGLTPVHPFNDEWIIAGQGTLGLEIAEHLPDVSVAVLPIGGGGLISGVALALKARVPGVRVVGVQAAGCAPVAASLAAGRPMPVASSRTIADGIAVKQPGALTLPLIRQFVDEVVTVEEDEIARAIAHLAQSARQVVEGAGAAGVAALLAGKVRVAPGETVCAPLCGGNIDANLLVRVLERTLVQAGRYLLLKTSIDDRPGNLAPLISEVARAGANVVDIFHRRAAWLVPVDRVGLELVLEVRDEAHGREVVEHLTRVGYHVEREGQMIEA